MASTSGIDCAATCLLVIAVSMPAQAYAHAGAPLGANEISRALSGQTCETKNHAKFTFGLGGIYSYEGLWNAAGHYEIKSGSIVVSFDSGLERSFIISKIGKELYIENTRIIFCRPSTSDAAAG